MSDTKTALIISKIKEALGPHYRLFDIGEDSVLVDEHDTFSCLIYFQPKKDLEYEDTVVTGSKVFLQFDIYDNEPLLITGEDSENEISLANIYGCLYWNEATAPTDFVPITLPKTPAPEHIDSIAMRIHHGFGLLSREEKETLRRQALQMYEEVTGQGFYKLGDQ